MNEKTRAQIEAMKNQTIGVEVEMNNITREKAAKKVAEFFVEYHKARHGSRFGAVNWWLMNIENILYYSNERKEREVFVVPGAVQDGYVPETWDDMELYGKERLQLLKKFLELPAGIPSHDTFNRVFSLLNPKSLETALQEWITSLISTLPPDLIAIDGKSLRGSNTPSAHSFVHMVSAFACSSGLSLAQIKVDEKSNEITAIPKLLDMIDIEGCTISIDAMGCQKEIAAKIISKKADYILALKGNQPSLRLDALLMSKNCYADDDYIDTDGGHGRVERRRTRIYRDMSYVSHFWPGVSAVIRVDSLRYDKSKAEYQAVETRFYITSLHHVEASQFARWIRAHWGIENQLHWVLDVAFNEDASQKRAGNSAENFSRLLRFARNILKRYKEVNPMKLSYP